MKKLILLSAILFAAVIVSAQTDFSGSWKLNSSKSQLGDQFSMAPKEIIIDQNDNDISVEKHSNFQGQDYTINDKYTLDGKESINDGWMDSKKKSTVTWSDDKKSLKVVSKIPMQDGGDMTINENYKMDGDNMVIESSASSSYGDMTETMVYDKQ